MCGVVGCLRALVEGDGRQSRACTCGLHRRPGPRGVGMSRLRGSDGPSRVAHRGTVTGFGVVAPATRASRHGRRPLYIETLGRDTRAYIGDTGVYIVASRKLSRFSGKSDAVDARKTRRMST